VPPCAFNATSTSLRLGHRALTRCPRCVRPTSAIHSLPEPVPALSVLGLLCHPPVRAGGATEGSVVSRRAGPASTDRAATRPGCHRRVPFAGFYPLEKRRGLAPYTTSSLTPRHPPGHASAFAGQFAWGPVGSRSLSPRPVKGATSHDPRCLPPLRSPRSPAEAPPPCLATR